MTETEYARQWIADHLGTINPETDFDEHGNLVAPEWIKERDAKRAAENRERV